jgi:4-diphosphocytidyl-2-C-methyl-D-erythritol kinase
VTNDGRLDNVGPTPLVRLTAPAKLTLNLRVVGVRPDGYHLLESEMVSLDLADTLEITNGEGLTIVSAFGWTDDGSRAGTTEGLPSFTTRAEAIPATSDNLVARALEAADTKAHVRLIKRIPPGAGLGGGSADAAAILRWAGCARVDVAVRLGADVPFCLTGGRAVVRGIGEDITTMPSEHKELTLLLLPFGVDTAAVYRAWDDLARENALAQQEESSNDLEAPALLVEPRLVEWKRAFADATGLVPHLAGSGSTWFVEGRLPDPISGGRRTLRVGGEEGLLVPVRTTPAVGQDGTRAG